jgi:hypothetical protein
MTPSGSWWLPMVSRTSAEEEEEEEEEEEGVVEVGCWEAITRGERRRGALGPGEGS